MKKFVWCFAVLVLAGCSNTGSQGDTPEDTTQSASESSVVESKPETAASSVESAAEPEETVVSFVGVGDNLIHGVVFQDARQSNGEYDFTPMYRHLEEEISAADLAFINQETMLGGDEFGFSGYPAFNTPSAMAQNLADVGFDMVNAATNHSLDKGTAGVLNSLETWQEQEEVLYTGVFDSEEHREEIPVIEREGLTIALLSYTYGTNGIPADTTYRVNYFDEETITADVQRAKEVSDFVVVSAHWGDENTFAPNEFQERYAQLFADVEVDAVIGTHSHTIQPVEWIEGKTGHETLVVYSLGNFLSAMVADHNVLGGMISFDFVEEGTETSIENVQWIPTVTHYEATPGNMYPTRRNFAVYKLSDYTEELASKHALNGFDGQVITKQSFQQLTEELIDDSFLP